VADLALVIPVRDERPGLERLLPGLARLAQDLEVVVIDDHSCDGSGELATSAGLRVVCGPGRGYGAAVKLGVSVTTSPFIATIDADGSYDLDAVAVLAMRARPFGMVIGARSSDQVLARRALKALARWLVRLTTGLAIPDLNSGLRVFDRRLFERLRPRLPERFSLTTTMTLACLAEGAPLDFVPVRYGVRLGRSKFGPLDACRFMRTVVRGCALVRRSRHGEEIGGRRHPMGLLP
jgi:glycosyltransferase involved in cell wall biosynthesis